VQDPLVDLSGRVRRHPERCGRAHDVDYPRMLGPVLPVLLIEQAIQVAEPDDGQLKALYSIRVSKSLTSCAPSSVCISSIGRRSSSHIVGSCTHCLPSALRDTEDHR
jgi:hypothetical protein